MNSRGLFRRPRNTTPEEAQQQAKNTSLQNQLKPQVKAQTKKKEVAREKYPIARVTIQEARFLMQGDARGLGNVPKSKDELLHSIRAREKMRQNMMNGNQEEELDSDEETANPYSRVKLKDLPYKFQKSRVSTKQYTNQQ
jgi:hypothetical protein